MSNDGTPVRLLRLWGLSERSRLGRPATLDVGRVVAAAVSLADRDGLDGVTLPKVAEALGVTSMSLYRHVGSKDELFVLMADAALGRPPDLDFGAMPWRDGLRRWADEQRAVYRRRPWLARVPLSGPPEGPNRIAWMEVALTALRDTNLGWAAKVGVLTLISGYVRHITLLAQDLAAGRARDVDQVTAEQTYGRALAQLVDPVRFPEVAKLFASTIFDRPPAGISGVPELNNDYRFGLEVILDGVAAAIQRANK